MRRRSAARRRRLSALVLLGLLVAASVSYTSRYPLDIVDKAGQPHTAYAVYNHQGEWLNPAHPVSYNATRLTVIRMQIRRLYEHELSSLAEVEADLKR